MESPREDRLGDLLHRAVRTMRHAWADSTSSWDLSPHQARALDVIAGRPGHPGHPGHPWSGPGPRLSAIAERLRIAPRSATEVVDGLEERGLVERLPDPEDRRATCVRLTESGRRVQEEMRAARTTTDESWFGRLDADERAELATLLRKLVAVDEDGQADGSPDGRRGRHGG